MITFILVALGLAPALAIGPGVLFDKTPRPLFGLAAAMVLLLLVVLAGLFTQVLAS